MATAPGLWEELLPLTSRLRGRILDAGCGNGRWAMKLTESSDVEEVVCLDIDSPDVASVEDRSFNQNVAGWFPPLAHARGDVRRLAFQCSEFDGVFCWRVLHDVSESGARRALREFARVTRPGGMVMIRMPNDDPRRRPDDAPETAYWALRTCWSPTELEQYAGEASLCLQLPVYIDVTNSMVGLFRNLKIGR